MKKQPRPTTHFVFTFLLSLSLLLTLTQAASAAARVAAPDDGFNPGINGVVYALAVQADGKILVGGAFSMMNGQARSNLGRLNPDGSLDTIFNLGTNHEVYALTMQEDGKILVGGPFTTLGGQSRDRIARLNVDGSLDTSFNPGADGTINALALQPDGKILIGGSFDILGGQPRKNLARLNADGSLDATFNPGASSAVGVNGVTTLAVQPDGKILVGGLFTTLAAQPRDNIGRLNANGSLDATFNPGADYQVTVLAIQPDGKVVVGGAFNSLGGQPRSYLGRLNANGSLDLTFNPGADGSVHALALTTDGKILVGGVFNHLGGHTRISIGRLNADGSLDLTFNTDAGGGVLAMAVQADGNSLVGGYFNTLDEQPHEHIGRLSSDTPALQSLTVDPAGFSITWLRSGSGPEVGRVTFEQSTDDINYSLIGSGTRVTGGWQLTGLNLPTGQDLHIRARGYYQTGYSNASSSVAELVQMIFLDVAQAGPIFTVNITADHDDGQCSAADCTLREAIDTANTHTNGAAPDEIHFNISTGCNTDTGVCTIAPTLALPIIEDPVIIDGYTQPGAHPNSLLMGTNAHLLIELSGERAPQYTDGLMILTQTSTIRGIVINRFHGEGISSYDTWPNTIGTIIQGNFIGTDPTGSFSLPNADCGVFIQNTPNARVGGTDPAARNLISGNSSYGIVINSEGSMIQGNLIGTDASGSRKLGNRGAGILVDGNPYNTLIGGTLPNAGNLITGNSGDGVIIRPYSGRQVLGNAIFDNDGLGIDLTSNTPGVNHNDPGDGDEGQHPSGNDLQNFPVITSLNSGSLSGMLNSERNATYRIEFFANTACDSSGYGEGEQFIGALDPVIPDESGNAVFTFSFTPVTGKPYITATATNLISGSTSEFSPCQPASRATTTSLSAPSDFSTYGQYITLTASVTTGILDAPYPAGQVQFKDGDLPLGSPVTVNYLGQAVLVTNALTPGAHLLVAEFIANAAFNSSSGSLPFSVSPKNLTVYGINAKNKEYDGTTSAVLDTSLTRLSGVLNDDDVHINTESAKGVFFDPNTGPGKTVTISDLVLTGSKASYYTLTQPTTYASITPRLLTLSAENKHKVYGEAVPALTVAYSGFAPGETPAVLTHAPELSTTATQTSPPGVYPITIMPGSPAALNYTFAIQDGELTVEKASTLLQISISPLSPRINEPVTFTAVVEAEPPGAGIASGTVTFDCGDGISQTVSLNPNNNGNAQATFTTDTLTAGSHTLTATYSGDDKFATSTGQVTFIVAPTADLAITLQASQNPVPAGSLLTLTFTATNRGTAPAESTVMDINPPAGMNFLSATSSAGSPCTQDRSMLSCNLGDLAPSTSQTVTVELAIPRDASGIYTASGSLNSPSIDPPGGGYPAVALILTVEPRTFLFLPLLAR